MKPMKMMARALALVCPASLTAAQETEGAQADR